jgi:hypothetical protein
MQVTEHVLFFSYFVVVFISLENCYVDEKDILLIKVLKFLIFCTKKNHHLSLRACLFACLLACHRSYFHTRKNKIEWSEPPDYY